MSTYLDTSFLLKMYVYEAESLVAQAVLTAQQNPLISSLTDVEVASGLFRRLPFSTAQKVYADYQRDRRSEVYRKLDIDENTFRNARVLAEQHSGTMSLRSLDLLHLATAFQYGADTMATYDRHLAAAAAQLGLSVLGARP